MQKEHEEEEEEDEEDAEARETDSDSDSYSKTTPDSAEQKRTASSLRSLCSFLAFEYDAKFAPRADAAVVQLIKAPSDSKAMRAVVELHGEIKQDPGEVLAFKQDRLRHAAAIGLYALAPHLRLTKNKVYHADLLRKLLENLAGRTHDLEGRDIQHMSVFAYWSESTMGYRAVALKILSASDEEYRTMPLDF